MRQFKKGRIIQFTVQRKLKNEFRPSFNIRNWFRMGTERDKIISELSPIQRAANTTRGLTPGLLSPGLGEAGGRIPLPPNLTHTASSGVVKDTNFKARALQIYRADPSQPLNLLNETPGVKSSALGISEKKLESGNQVSSGEIIELSDPPSPQDPNSVSEDSESAQESLTLADSRQTSQRFLKPASRLPATPSATFPRDFRTSFGERPSTHAATNFSVSTAHSPSLENRIQTLEEAILLNQSNKGQNKETSRNFHAKSATQAWNNEWDAQMPCHSQHLMEQDNFNTQNLSERLSFEQTRNIEEISARPSHHRDDQPVLTLTPFRCDNPFLRDQQFQTEPLIKTEKPDDILASWPQHIATTTGYQQSHDRNLARTPPSGSQGLPRTPRRRRRAESSIDDPPPSPPQPPRQRRRESNTKYESVDTSAWRLPDGTFHGLPAMPPAHTRPRINLRREYETQERILNIRRALTGRDPHWEERPVRRGRLRRGLQKP